MTNGFCHEPVCDVDKDVVLSVAFNSSPMRPLLVEFSLKLPDVRNALHEATSESSKVMGYVSKHFAMFCNVNGMSDCNDKVVLERLFGRWG